jgi:arylsulfatase A-like enzyme
VRIIGVNLRCRQILRAAALGLGVAMAGCGGGDESGVSETELPATFDPVNRSNVVLIVVDTLRKDRLGCYGHSRSTSPNIDALARRGVRYERAFAHAPWTTPSIGALLTSQYPSVLQIVEEPNKLKQRFVLLSEVLQEAGYQTGAAISHSFLDTTYQFNQGFDMFDQSNIMELHPDEEQVSSPGVASAAVKFIEENASRPFFLFAHFFDPHYHYLRHAQFDFAKEVGYSGSLDPMTSYEKMAPLLRSGHTQEELEFLRALYDGEIAFTDQYVGEILNKLEELEIDDRTMIIFTADHGEEFMERGYFGHAMQLFNEAVNVPLIVKYPADSEGAALQGTVSQLNVGLVDLYPTVLDTLGVSIDHPIMGRNVLDDDYAERNDESLIFIENSRFMTRRAVVQGDLKLVYDLQADRYSLFDFAADPLEKTDLIDVRTEDAAPLRAALVEWMEQMIEFELLDGGPEAVELSPQQIKILKGIGYLGGSSGDDDGSL